MFNPISVLSPPRRDLKVSDPEIKDKSLFELRLAPQSNLFFRFLDDSIALDCELNISSRQF